MNNPSHRNREHASSPELKTSVRYSFADAQHDRNDTVINHVSGKVRVIDYPAPQTQLGFVVLQTLLDNSLLLGSPIQSERESRMAFKVPNSSRPLGYEASSQSRGAYSYGDDQLFYDLGGLLGQATNIGLQLHGSLGSNIALVEFTRPDERKLYFVPGIEKSMQFQDEKIEAIGLYAEKLQEEFTGRFHESAIYFRMGFNEAAGTSA